jgi:predicted lipoprotein with Yx(FWY)xxD motif
MNTRHFHATNNRLAFLASILMMGIFVLTACMQAATPTTAQGGEKVAAKSLSTPTQQQAAPVSAEPTISVATDAKLGQILVGDKGMTLYMFTKDGPNQSNCDAKCLSAWPPLITQGHPTLGAGVDSLLVGTATLADGRMIVTYNKMPLYYWVQDTKPGDTTGQGVGKVWYVVSPDGKAVGIEGAGVSATPTQQPVAPMTTEPTISVATDAKLGQILVGDKGMTLYIFTKDGPNQSNCNADCLAKWPPLITEGHPTLGAGVDASLIGTATLADGRMIVTYNKMPLYYWIKDTKPGDTTGQGVGQVWYVISPDGKVVEGDSANGSAAPAQQQIIQVPAEPTVSITTDAKLGKFLVDDKGMALYMFKKDGPDQSNCTGDCLKAWPPLLTEGNPSAGQGVDASLIGTATLADGSKIVTYNKMPLYYFAKDTKPGDITGEGVGGVWFLVSPSGQLIPLPVIPTPKPPKQDNGGMGGRNY